MLSARVSVRGQLFAIHVATVVRRAIPPRNPLAECVIIAIGWRVIRRRRSHHPFDLCVWQATAGKVIRAHGNLCMIANYFAGGRSEEHTSELQSRGHLVCRLLLEKKKKKKKKNHVRNYKKQSIMKPCT